LAGFLKFYEGWDIHFDLLVDRLSPTFTLSPILVAELAQLIFENGRILRY
jgi:hypothetical protein